MLVSALSGEGVDAVADRASVVLTASRQLHHLHVDLNDGAALAWLHAHGNVEREETDGERITIAVRLTGEDFARFQAR